METSPRPELPATILEVLRGFGLDRSNLAEEWSGGQSLTPERVAEALPEQTPEAAYEHLLRTLAQSDRGIEAPRRYWNQAPAYHLTDLLAPYGCEVRFEPVGDREGIADGPFEVVLEVNGDCQRTTFEYPDHELGTDNYPALVYVVQSELLPTDAYRFVHLTPSDDSWRFLLLETERLESMREKHGARVEVFDRPVLSDRQPPEFVPEDPSPDPAPETVTSPDLSSVMSDADIDDAFQSIEREAATQPVTPTTDLENGDDSAPSTVDAHGDADVDAILGSEGEAAVPEIRDISGEQLELVVERFEADPTAVEPIDRDDDTFDWLTDVSEDDDQSTVASPDRDSATEGGTSGADTEGSSRTSAHAPDLADVENRHVGRSTGADRHVGRSTGADQTSADDGGLSDQVAAMLSGSSEAPAAGASAGDDATDSSGSGGASGSGADSADHTERGADSADHTERGADSGPTPTDAPDDVAADATSSADDEMTDGGAGPDGGRQSTGDGSENTVGEGSDTRPTDPAGDAARGDGQNLRVTPQSDDESGATDGADSEDANPGETSTLGRITQTLRQLI